MKKCDKPRDPKILTAAKYLGLGTRQSQLLRHSYHEERGEVLHNRGSLGMTSSNNINMAASEDWRAPAFRQKVISQMQVLNLIA